MGGKDDGVKVFSAAKYGSVKVFIVVQERRASRSPSWRRSAAKDGKVTLTDPLDHYVGIGAERFLTLWRGFANGKAHGAEGAERFRAKRDEVSVTCEALTLWLSHSRCRALPVYGSDNPRRATLHTGFANRKALKDVFLGACRRRRRRGGLKLYQLRAAWGATGQLSGIRLGLWVSASGGAAQSASMFIQC